MSRTRPAARDSLMLIGFIGILVESVRRYLRYQTQLSCIAQLDERILIDIGLSRGELRTEAWNHTAR
jgi:uncharacterized protein YjiS (DUF1127 family)